VLFYLLLVLLYTCIVLLFDNEKQQRNPIMSKTIHISIRLTKEEKARLKKVAGSEFLKLSTWMKRLALKECEAKEKELKHDRTAKKTRANL